MGLNRVCEILQIRYPIIEGGMAFVGNGELAAAVSNAGGFGQIGTSGRTVENFEEQVELAVKKTTLPFGVNIPISGYSSLDPYIQVIEKHKDKIYAVSLASGDPRPYIPFFKEMGMKILVLIGSVKHALNAEKAGADIVICEGFEAGGRNSPYELTLFGMIPQISKAVQVPVIAAGGIATGAGVMAAMTLGAEGVQMGTRFIATKECQAHENYKKLLVESKDFDTMILERSVGRVNRVIKNPYVQEVAQLERKNISPEELYPYISGKSNRIAAIEGRLEEGWVHAGQSVGMIQSVGTVEEEMGKIIEEIKVLRTELSRNFNDTFN
jgi:enoyl-[acyl-carrier protein] reductase II